MLDLVRLSPRSIFPPGGKELYRQIAVLAGFEAGDEVLVVPCGSGVTLEYFAREFEIQGSGVDPDPVMAGKAEDRFRSSEGRGRVQIQHASVDDLPYRDGIFDAVVAELGLTAWADPREAIRELVRVARPGGRIAVVHLVWKAPVEEERREALSQHLGVRPLMLVELKRILRDAGVSRLHVEGWTDEETAFRPAVKKPFPDFAELFTLPEKIGILRRAWSRWGWKGVRTAVTRELTVHRLLTRERILGLDLVMGRKVEHPEAEPSVTPKTRTEEEGEGEHEELQDLPLFAPDHKGG